MVEHDPDLIRTADHVVDMGPLSGINGGEIIYQGTFEELKNSSGLTGAFLEGRIPIRKNHVWVMNGFQLKMLIYSI